MLKDATSEDLASLSQQSTEGLSEIARLQQLPGFAKIKKALFYNLMSARPDTSDQNVRCIPSDIRKHNDLGEGAYNPIPPSLKKFGQHEKSSQDFRDFNVTGISISISIVIRIVISIVISIVIVFIIIIIIIIIIISIFATA